MLDLAFDQSYWLELEVNSDTPMVPRYEMACSPYAFRAITADSLEGLTTPVGELNQLNGIGATVTAANLDTLTDTSNADALHAHSHSSLAGLSSDDHPQYLRSDATDSYTSGTMTFNAGTTLNAAGTNPVADSQTDTLAFANGGNIIAAFEAAAGVGINNNFNRTAIRARANALGGFDQPVIGIDSYVSVGNGGGGQAGYAVWARANVQTGNPGYAVRSEATGAHGGANYGVWSTASNSTTNNYGVYGEAASVGGVTAYGVYGTASGAGTNWAGYFQGDLNVTGTISKGACTFLIDHPLDPANKVLRHSLVESPEMANIYKGRASLTDGASRIRNTSSASVT